MAYNKLEKLQDNLQAITIALSLERDGRQATEEERAALRKYSGFGGLKFILNPCDEPSDIEKWSRFDRPYFSLTQVLFATLRDNSADEKEYQAYVRSLRNSVLTSFYTPKAVADTISKVLKKQGVVVKNYLEPSAGKGTFIESAKESFPGMKTTAFEKDLITGKVLKALYPNEDIHIDGFETISTAQQGKYDVVSSNIPFGDISVFDNGFATSGDAVKAASTKTIHNYFFLKALEQVREGGFVAFITSRGFMDSPSNDKIREELIRNARLVGAYRLPDGMFRDEAGTDVGSDLVVLQKYTGYDATLDPDSLAFCEVSHGFKAMSGEDWTDITMNSHWWKSFMAPDSEAMIGTKMERGTDPYGKPTLVVTHEGGIEGVSSLLEEYMSRDLYSDFVDYYRKNEPRPQRAVQQPKPRRVTTARKDQPVQLSLFDLWAEDTTPVKEQGPSMDTRPYKGVMLPHYRNGMVIEDNGQLGHLSNVGHDVTFTPIEWNDDQAGRMRLYVKIRDAYEQLYKQEADTHQEQPALREELNIHYDNFFVKYGYLNEKKNAKLFLMDVQGRDTLTLENSENGQFVKADIFLRPVAFSQDQDIQVMSPSDALSASLNRTGSVDLEYMASISDFTEEELRDSLKERIYLNPLVDGYEVADKFLAGNVVEKLEKLRQWHGVDEANEQELQRSISALEGVLPTPITYQELDFNFGERWMPKEYFSQFASEFFGTDIKISYAPQMDEFVIDVSGYSAKLHTEFAVTGETKTYDGEDLLRHALYNTVPDIKKCVGYKPNGDPIMGTDHEKVQLAASKIDEIRDAFTSWIDQHPEEWKKELADMYNRKFNCFVRASYDGSHQTFPGLDLKGLSSGKYKINEIYKSQKDCVWMILQNGGGVCDHEVGTGKTLTMCIAAHEMKRLGLAHKPIIIGMKANVAEIAATYQAAFPDDRILYASEKDFTPANRKEFFNRIKNNDYACVIMSHDQFGKIPQSADIQQQVIQEEINAIDEALEVYERQGHSVSGRMRSGLEKRKINLQNQLLTLNAALARRTDDIVDFKTMGIDHIFIDVSQAFKNLAFTTRDSRVAGLGDPKGSERARNLQYAIRTIQERTGRDLGVTFLSGTTISNSLTELYLLFKYLRPQAMSAQDINSFDAWAAVFARKSRDYEFNVAGNVVMKERYRQFIKVPELGAFYNEITDYKTAADVGLERPDMDVQLVNIQPTEDQQDFQQRLLQFAESGDGDLVFRAPLSDSEEKAKMLIVTNLGKKCSLSPKLVNPDYHEGDNTKIGVAARNISDIYYQYNEQKGTQFVFCDLSTPKKGEWSVYQELKDRLVNEYHIPEAEIQFIQDAGTEKKKKEFIDKMNRGDIRVMIGSTTMLGTGVNAQQRAVAVHHLDLPWRPSDMEQRNGRARRKGNEVARDFAGNTVKCFVYAVERSLDSYNFYLLQAKSEFIRQMKQGSLGKRSFDQGGEDADNGMPFAEYVAITSGNTDLLERAKLEKRVLGLESERKAFYKQQQVVQQKLSFTREQIRHYDSVLEKLNADKTSLERALDGVYDDDVNVFDAIRRDNSVFAFHSGDDPQLARYTFDLTQNNPYGDYMQKVARQEVNGEVTVAHLVLGDMDWPLVMSSKTEYNPSTGVNRWVGNKFSVVGGSGLHYTFNNGKVSLSDKNLAANYPFEAISGIPEVIKDQERQRKSYADQLPELERIANKVWEKADQLKELKEQLQALDRKIQRDMDSKVQQAGQKVEELPYTIEQKSWGREPWELKFAVTDYPYLNRIDRESVGEQFHGSVRVYDGTVTGKFRHQFGAESAIKELSKLNKEHKDDMEWLKAAVQEAHDSACIPALHRLREMGFDRHGRPLEGVDASHLKVISLGDYKHEEVRALAHGVKENNSVAIEAAVGAMAKALQEMPEAKNVVLVSIPSHKGYGGPVQRLAKELAEKTGIPYVDALNGAEHESLYEWKRNHPGEELPELFFSEDRDNPIPEGKTPVLIDNVIDTGHTAWAAVDALEAQPIMLTIGSTGKEQSSWHDIEIEVNPNGLDYIKSSTPAGVGLTGITSQELNALLLKAQTQEDTDAKRDLRRVGIDWYTGQPRYLVSHIVDKWNVAFSDDLEPVISELFEKGSSANIFSEDQQKHLSDAEKTAFDSLVSEVSERTKNGYSYQHLDAKRRLVITYEYLKEKADLAVKNAEAVEVKEVKPEAPSKEKYSTITDEEWSHMTTLVSDLQTGNHLLGRPRSDAYRQFFSEVARAHESVQSWTSDSEWTLTNRQKELLLAESNMYYEGISGLASFLEMDVQKLRNALDAVPVNEVNHEVISDQEENNDIDIRFKAAFAAALPDDPERLKPSLVDDFREVLHRAWYDNDLDARAAISKDYGLDWRYGVTNHTVENAEEDFEGISDEAYLMTASNIVTQRVRGLFDYKERNTIKDPQFELLEWYFEKAPEEIKAKNVELCRDFLLYTHILTNQYSFGPREDIQKMLVQTEDKKVEESPIMKQFHDLKAKHPDALLLFRTGDFYETYETDAKEASRILGITLMYRKGHSSLDGDAYAMAGFPFHALDTYLPKLIRAGKRVAICDQLEAPKQNVKRSITEMVNPGLRTQLVETMADVKAVLPHQAMLRDALIERMREARIKVNTNVAEGERILNEAAMKVRLMGSTTRNRQRSIGDIVQSKNLTDTQSDIIAAFSGKVDGKKVELIDSSGKTRTIILIQGKDDGIGIKHSVYHHYSTRRGVFNVDDVLKIPELVKIGSRHQEGKRIEYSAVLNEKKLTLVTERTSGGNEKFINFFSNKKIEKQRVFEAQKALAGDTDKSAGAANVLNSSAKLQQNSELTKEKLENVSEDVKIYQGEEARQIYGEILESERKSRELVFPAHTGAQGIFVEDGKYVAFDNSTNDCWVEEFKSEQVALSWVRGELSAEDAHKLDNIKLMNAGDRQAFGFVYNDEIYIDRNIATVETPLHEYTHLWAEVMRQQNPKEWENIVSLMKGNHELWQDVTDRYSYLTDENDIAEEVLAHYSGKRGFERMEEEYRNHPGLDKDNITSIFDTLSDALSRLWSFVADFLHIHYTSKEQVADQILKDALNGVNPLDYRLADAEKVSNQIIRPHFIGEKGARNIGLSRGDGFMFMTRLLESAKDYEQQGYDALRIKQITGWERGADGKWRSELSGIRVKSMDVGVNTVLSDIVDAPDLFKAYPELKDVRVEIGGIFDNGQYNHETNTITLNEVYRSSEVTKEQYEEVLTVNEQSIIDAESALQAGKDVEFNKGLLDELHQLKESVGEQASSARSIDEIWPDINSVIAHEVQHVIQHIEGFAVGGNLRTVANMRLESAQAEMDKYQAVYDEYKLLEDKSYYTDDASEAMYYIREMDKYEAEHGDELKAYLSARASKDAAEMDIVAGVLSEKNFDEYRRLAGEVEARNVSRRAEMSVMERRNSLAASTEDVERDRQIISFGGLGIASQATKKVVVHPRSPRLSPQDREAGGALVDQLESMGIPVHTDNRENRRVLKAAEHDHSEIGKIRHLKTEHGESYGFAYKGEIHLDMRKVDAELPLHEYAHLWVEAMRRVNPENWTSVVNIIKSDAASWNHVKQLYPELDDDDDLAEEVIARYSGKRGAGKLRAELQRMTPRDENYHSRWNNIYKNISKSIQDFWKHTGDSLNVEYKNADDVADMIMKDFAEKVSPVKKMEKWLESRDNEYAAAVQEATMKGDWSKAHTIFVSALEENVGNGITPFMAVDGYRGKLDRLARAVKDGNNITALQEAVDLMASRIPANAVLVPVPSHLGYATDTLTLAKALGERTDVPVVDILKSAPRERQYDVKKTTGHPLTAGQLGIYMEGELPKGKMPFVIDNVVNSGNTAEACVKALGYGIVYSLASAVSQERHAATLKSAMTAVYDKEGRLVPLSERFDLKNKWLGRVMNYKPDKHNNVIAGLENYSEQEIEKYVREHFETVLEGSDIDAEIVAVKVIGSRVNGNSDNDSDLDVLLEFRGDISEDSLFNILNDEEEGRLYIEGIPVDINPITEGKSGTIEEFLERNKDYVKPVVVSNQNISVMEENEKLQATIKDVTSRDEKFRYQLLDRLKQDCNYFLGYGNRHEGSLWAGNTKDHVAVMQALWDSLPEKPEWLTKEQLADYASKMLEPEKDLQEKVTAIKEAIGEYLQKVANDYYSQGNKSDVDVLQTVRDSVISNELQASQVAREVAMEILQNAEANEPGILSRYGIEDMEAEADEMSLEATNYAKTVLYNKQNGVEQQLEEKVAALNERVKEFNEVSKAADPNYGIFNKPVQFYSIEKQDDDHFALISHDEETGKYATSWISAKDLDAKIEDLSVDMGVKIIQLRETTTFRQIKDVERDPELREATGYMNDVISEALPDDGDKITIRPFTIYNGDDAYTITSLYHEKVGDEHHFLANSQAGDISIVLDNIINNVSSANEVVAAVRESQISQLLGGRGGIDFIQRYGSPYKVVNDATFGELAYIKEISTRDGKVTIDGAIDNDGAPVYVKELKDLRLDGIDNLFAEVREVVNWKPSLNLTMDQALMVADHHGLHSEVEVDLMGGMEPELALQKHHIMPTPEQLAEIESLNDPDQVPVVDAVPMILDKVIPNDGDELVLDGGGAILDFQYIGFGYQELEGVKSIKHIGDGYVASNGEHSVDVSRLASGPDGDYFLKVIKDTVKQMEDKVMSEEKKQEEVAQQQEAEKQQEKSEQQVQAGEKKKGWYIDYTKYAMPEGVKVEKANVYQIDRGDNVGKYAVSALVDGKRTTRILDYSNDVTAYFTKDENGNRKATAEQLLAKVMYPDSYQNKTSSEKKEKSEQQVQAGEKKKGWNIDYTKYSMPEGAVVTNASVSKDENDGKWKIMATINGELRSADLYLNDRQAYFEKNEQGERKATVDQLVAKYFSKSTAEKMGKSAAEIDSVGELENAAAEAQETVAEERAAEKQEEQELQAQEAEEKKEAEQKKDGKEEVSSGLALQTALLVGALHAANKHDGIWMNEAGKQAPVFWPKENKPSAFNGLMMALHSDANDYKTNMYTTFAIAKSEGVSVRGKEKGLPYNWDDWSKFENKYNKNDVIDREKYLTLDPQEKDLYRVQFRKEMRPIFNIDQTTLPMAKKELYNFLVQVEDKEAAKDNLQAVKAEQVAEVKAKYPDSLMLFREDGNYVMYGEDAKKAAAVLHMSVVKPNGEDIKTENISLSFPKEELDTHLPRLIRDGNRIAICDDVESSKLQRLTTAEEVYAASERLVASIGEAGGVINKDMAFTQYDGEKDVLNLGRRMSAVPGQEMTQAMEHASEVYRAAVTYTGTADRLNRGSRLELPGDRDKYERLVQELSAGVMMTRMGLPATISKENRELIPYWERELKEDPKLLDCVERDVNKAIQVLDKISAGEKVDYAVLRGERPMQTVKPRTYTIASELATIPNIEHKQVVVVRDQQNKSAAVILPAGASLEMNNEVPGMNKNRFVIALRNEGIEDVKFYNAGGALGLNQPNEFFAGKEVDVAHLKQYTLVRDETVDLSQELARTNKVDIEKVSAIKNDQNEWVFYVKPVEGEAITIKPEASDLSKFFSAYQTPQFDAVREELAQKYYGLAQQHPEYKQDFLMPKVENIDLERIKQVHIQKDKFDENKIYVTCLVDDQRVNTRIDRDSPEWQRFWLVDDKTGYKVNLAAKLFEAELNKGQEKTVVQSQEEVVTETEEVVVDNGQEEVDEEQQSRGRTFHR